MVQDTEVIASGTTVNGAQARSSIYRYRPQHERTHEPIQVSLTAGTGSINIEARASQNDPWVLIQTFAATDIVLVPVGLEVSVNVTAATGLTYRVTGARPLAFVA